MNKRIRRKKTRMKLVKEFENMNDGDGAIFVDGKIIKFNNGCAAVYQTDDTWPNITISAYIRSITRLENKNGKL